MGRLRKPILYFIGAWIVTMAFCATTVLGVTAQTPLGFFVMLAGCFTFAPIATVLLLCGLDAWGDRP